MARVTNIRKWLRRVPHPSRVVADGRELVVTDGPRKWADIEAAIQSMQPATVEAQDAEGRVLRVAVLGDDDDEPAAPDAAPSPFVAHHHVAPLPPPRSELSELARLLVEAGDRAAARHAEAYALAFSKQAEIISLMMDRLTNIELAYQQMIDDRAADAAEAAADAAANAPSEGLGQLTTLVAAGMSAAAQPKANGKA